MVKKAKTANDKSRRSTPTRPSKRPIPTENASRASVRKGSPKASTSSRKSDSFKLTPTRSSTRNCRSTAKVAAMEESSDSDCTPPPSIISRSPMKKRTPEKRAPRNEKEVMEPDVIDLTETLSPKSPRKRPKIDRRLPVDQDTFINLCSDEEMNPQPRKKRKVLPADEVIFISSGDEAELPGTRFVQRIPPLSECAAEMRISKGGYVTGHSAANADPVVLDTSRETETYDNYPDMSTPPPVSPLQNGSPVSAVIDITAGQDMTRIEEMSIPRLSRERLNTLYRASQQNPPVKSLMSEESSTSFCNTPGPEPKQQTRQVVLKQAKRALLTSLIFARPMRSLGRMSRPRTNVILQCSNASKSVALIASPVEETNSIHQGNIVTLDSQKIVLDTPTSSTVSPPSSTDTVRSADTPVNVATSDKFLDSTTCEDIRVSSASSLMEVDGTEVEPGQVKSADLSISADVIQASCMGETSAKMPSLEIVVGGSAMTKAHDISTPPEGEADDYPTSVKPDSVERKLNTCSVDAATSDTFPDTNTEENRVSSASPLMEIDETGVEPVFSTRLKSADDPLKDAVPASCTGGSSAKDVPSPEIVIGENDVTKAYDAFTPREGQADDLLAEAGFTDSEPMQNPEKQLLSGVTECVSRISAEIEQAGDIPMHPCATSIDDTPLQTPSHSAVQADGPIIHPTFRDSHSPPRDPDSHGLCEGNKNPDEPLDDSLRHGTSPILQTYINSSIFELEHTPNLTFQVLFTSNKILDDVSDLAISLPCYPERLGY